MSQEKLTQNEQLTPKILYNPEYHENEIEKFKKFSHQRIGVKFDDYWGLHEWSCQNYPEFWECVWHYYGIIHSKSYEQVFDRSRGFENIEWFKGARLNYAENIFKYRDSHVAIIATDVEENDEYVTYKEMYEEVCQYAAALKNIGVGKGDIVGCYMSSKKEAVFAFLATASIGAIWTGTLPLLGVKATLLRFQQISHKVIFASGNITCDGKDINMLDKLKSLAVGLPTLEKVVFVPSKTKGVTEDITQIPKCCTLNEFLEDTRREYRLNPWDLEYEQVPFDYPLSITFTSGTTGPPKRIIHSTGAFLANLKGLGLHQNITRKDVMLNFTPAGWISWNVLVNALHLGVTLVMYDGLAFEELLTRFWDVIEKFGLTSVCISSKMAEYIEMKGYLPTSQHSLKSLRQIFLTGSIMKPHSYDFFPRLKPGILAISAYGATEVFGLISEINSNLPVYKGEHQCFSLGMDVKCLDDDDKEVIGKKGYLVLANPYPAMPVSILNDECKQIVRDGYLNEHPGYWNLGDEGWINPVTKGFVVLGRCDEDLNPLGIRFNCSEIYFALDKFPGIQDTVCVAQFNKCRDERVILFVKMEPEKVLTEEVKEEIRQLIENILSYVHVPAVIMQAPDIPYSLTGKKLNILVKKLINKMPIPSVDMVINPESVDFFKNVDLGDF